MTDKLNNHNDFYTDGINILNKKKEQLLKNLKYFDIFDKVYVNYIKEIIQEEAKERRYYLLLNKRKNELENEVIKLHKKIDKIKIDLANYESLKRFFKFSKDGLDSLLKKEYKENENNKEIDNIKEKKENEKIKENKENEKKNNEKKKRIPLWIYPSTETRIMQNFESDNCKSPSEFIERAVLFYLGYLSQTENVNYISPMITETVKAEIKGTEQRLARLLFKVAVELGKVSHLIAATNDVDDETLRQLQAMCANEVRRINGIITSEDAVRYQQEE